MLINRKQQSGVAGEDEEGVSDAKDNAAAAG